MRSPDHHIVFVFLDGLGLGVDDPEINPFARLTLPAFTRLAGNQCLLLTSSPFASPTHTFRHIDATLGVEGLPQSGTGQASLLTGVDCIRLAGRHYGPYPHSKTRKTLASLNIFQRIKFLNGKTNTSVAFANAYPPRFFSYVKEKNRWTVTTRICLDAGVPVRDIQFLKNGLALTADLTGKGWPDLDPGLKVITEEEAANRLINISRGHTLTLFEYFLTDKAGHNQSADQAHDVLDSLDRFFTRLLSLIDPARDLLLVTSDHGNLEDLSTKSHTRNPVPLIAYGRGADHFRNVNDITGVTPAIISVLQTGE